MDDFVWAWKLVSCLGALILVYFSLFFFIFRHRPRKKMDGENGAKK